MNLRDLPILRHLEDVGPTDPVFDLLVLLGPLVIALIALLGRTPVTMTTTTAYVLGFVAYFGWNATKTT